MLRLEPRTFPCPVMCFKPFNYDTSTMMFTTYCNQPVIWYQDEDQAVSWDLWPDDVVRPACGSRSVRSHRSDHCPVLQASSHHLIHPRTKKDKWFEVMGFCLPKMLKRQVGGSMSCTILQNITILTDIDIWYCFLSLLHILILITSVWCQKGI